MRAAVWGSPIAHSLSPALHRAAYTALGLGWEYDRADVDAEALPGALARLGPEWAGVSLTMPLKAAALPLLARISPLAAAVGAVNTLVPLPGVPAPAWRGENTDVHGIVAALAEAGVGAVPAPGAGPRTAAVLGGGATAASAVAALAELGVAAPVVHVRSPQRAAPLLEVGARLGADVRLRPWGAPEVLLRELLAVDVVVSTAPAGAADGLAAALSAGSTAGSTAGTGDARPAGVLLDVVYAPWPTGLAAAWSAAGGAAVGGFAMLVHQAGRQVELMTGRPAPIAAMRAAGEAAMAERPQHR